MKEHEKVILASIGGIGIYLFIRDKTFRKCVIKAWEEFAKSVAKQRVKNTSSGVRAAGKRGNVERS